MKIVVRTCSLFIFLVTIITFVMNGTAQEKTNSPAQSLSGSELEKVFTNPPAEYRGKPFWSWNGELKKDELFRQMQVIKDMGMGGFFMHSRTGLATEYMGKEWFEMINACADEGAKQGMEAWLYDEDRWPSGTAGGLVTIEPKFRLKFMTMQIIPGKDFEWKENYTAAFSVQLKGVAYTDCQRITKDTAKDSYTSKTVLAFFIEEMEKSPFYNGYTYTDTMNKEAIAKYIELTHEKYKQECGDRLGKSIKGIFTDEPHRGAVLSSFGKSNANPQIPWTEALPARFKEKFHVDVISHLPEIFLQPNGQKILPVKWQYMELTQELFLDSFAKPIYDWCKKNNMLFTGHVLHEDCLTSQSVMQGSLMRFYEYMDYPGVDVLTEGNRNYWIVKQLSSAARQLGKKWLLSELYGCTGWQMNFENYKAVGDWQALFGINLRCPHLSWYTMAGEAKRDYPASIFYQSGWYKDFQFVEDYFSRLHTMLNQGKPNCDVLVLNPIESLWCQIYDGWADGLSAKDPDLQKTENKYSELFFWLIRNQIDFDYGDEDMIARLYRIEKETDGTPILWIGKAVYKTVVVSGMTTIRATSLHILDEFTKAGGKVIFAGDVPSYVDALPSRRAAEIASQCIKASWDKESVVRLCKNVVQNPIEIIEEKSQKPTEEIFSQMRLDGERKILVTLNTNPEKEFNNTVIRFKGKGIVEEWEATSGKRFVVPTKEKDGFTEISANYPPSGDHVFVISDKKSDGIAVKPAYQEKSKQALSGPFAYTLTDKNVCVLDLARYQVQGKDWQAENEILKIDQAIRNSVGLALRGGEMVQPWYSKKYSPKPEVKGNISLAFDFYTDELPKNNIELALEQPECFTIKLNGQVLDATTPSGWWVDPAFKTIPVPVSLLKKDKNEVVLECGFRDDINLEALYLLGDFGVKVEKTKKTLVSLPEKLAIGDAVSQGLPFYSGGIVYKVPVSAKPGAGESLFINIPKFTGACLKVSAEGQKEQLIAWQPYSTDITKLSEVKGEISVEVVLTRRNTFGPLHQIPLKVSGYGPGNFITGGKDFTLDYMLYPAGLLEAPEIKVMQEVK